MTPLYFPGDTYETPSNAAFAPATLAPGAFFYPRLFGIVFSEGIKASLGGYGGDAWAHASMRVTRALLAVGVKMHIAGMENIPSGTGPCVFIGNHMSTLETLVLPCIIQPRTDTTFVVKKSLIDYPVFKHVLRSRNPIVVGRENPREDLSAVLAGGLERLKAGRSIIVFPQSTRSPVLDPKLFNSIGVKLAKRAGVPVVPLALKTDAWGAGTFIKEAGPISPSIPVHFAFGKPLAIEGSDKEVHAMVYDFIDAHLREWAKV